MELKLPAPSLVVLVGPSAAGKSTWAASHFAPSEIVSSDSLRAMVGAGEDDQAAGTVAFQLLETIVAERLRRGLTTVIDTTGLDREARARWATMAHESSVPAHAVVFEADREVLEARNAARERSIPKSVIHRQHQRARRAIDELADEPFDGIHREQPVAMVTPRVATASAPEASAGEADGHSFGLILSRFDWGDRDLGSTLTSVARRAELAGFRDIWVMDHFRQIPQVGRAWEDIPEAYTALTHIAAGTTTLRLGALVTAISHRHPVVLGKMLATLDVISGGRVICGLGAAWDEKEHAAYGIELPAVGDRYDLLEETLQMLPLLWGKGSPSYSGRMIQADELICYPRPIQDPIPVWVGGSGERRTLRLVARYADACNVFGDPERVAHKREVLHRHCVDAERDPAEIEVTHLLTALASRDRSELRDRVERLRQRNETAESYMTKNQAGTVDDLAALFARYHEVGASHSIVSIPDVEEEGSIEAFGEVIASLSGS